MKKIICVFLLFSILVFLLPVVFTKSYKKAAVDNNIEVKENENENENETKDKNNEGINNNEELKLEKYEYKNYSTIKLLHKESGQIEEMPLDEYLLGVISAEMPASFEQEALNAQAVVARTYTLYSIMHNQNKHEGADICDDSNCCQAWISKEKRLEKWNEENRNEYWNKIVQAINNTLGKIITYNGEIIDAFFHSNSGGKTETPVNVWGGTNYPYLQSVETSGEDAYSQYSSEVILSKEELDLKMKEKHPEFQIDYLAEDAIKILEYTDSNRVKTIKIGNINLSGTEIRGLLGLKSTNFNVLIEDNNIKFSVIGYGHGVGMSQTGADSMAKQGKRYDEIIKHFYTSVEIQDL